MKSERWSNTNEIERVLTSLEKSSQGGVILFRRDGINLAYCGEGHLTIIGGSGTGKSRRVTYAQLRALIIKAESFIVIDPKGELYKNTAFYAKKTHDIKVFNCRTPGFSKRWNPLRYAWELFHRGDISAAQEKVRELVKDLTASYRTVDTYWKESMENLITGMCFLLVQYANKEQCHIGTIYNLLSEDRDSLDEEGSAGIVRSGLLQKAVESLPGDAPAKKFLAGYLSAAMATRSSVLTTVTNKLVNFCITDEIKNLTTGDDFDIANLDTVDKPLAVYIIIPDGSKIYDELSGMLVSQLTNHFISLADKKYNGKLPNRMNIILEELGNIGRSISDLPHLMSASRSRNIRLTLVVQSLSQLDSLYGAYDAETIRGNTDVWMMFRNSNWDTLQTFSRQCGERKIKAGDIVEVQPLINPTQLGAMEIGQALVLISGRTKFITLLPDYTEMFDCSDLEEVPISKTEICSNNRPLRLYELPNLIASEAVAARRQESPYKKMFRNRQYGGDYDD